MPLDSMDHARKVDHELELPATAGHNTAILNGKLEEATAKSVRASE
jgi:hypothetical protein